MDRRCKHLNGEERGVILAEHRRATSFRAPGWFPRRRTSTIGRELWRCRPEGGRPQRFCAQLGGARNWERGLRRTMLTGGSITPELLMGVRQSNEIKGRLGLGHRPFGECSHSPASHQEGYLIKGAFNHSTVGSVDQTRTPTVCAPVLPHRHRPEHHQADRTERRCVSDEPSTPKTLGWNMPDKAMAKKLTAFRSSDAHEIWVRRF